MPLWYKASVGCAVVVPGSDRGRRGAGQGHDKGMSRHKPLFHQQGHSFTFSFLQRCLTLEGGSCLVNIPATNSYVMLLFCICSAKNVISRAA